MGVIRNPGLFLSLGTRTLLWRYKNKQEPNTVGVYCRNRIHLHAYLSGRRDADSAATRPGPNLFIIVAVMSL